MEGLQKVVRCFPDADNSPNSHQNITTLLFGPCTMFLEMCMLIYFVIFALSRQITKQKVCVNS